MARIRMHTDSLRKGMIIGHDVFSHNGLILVPKGTVVNKEVQSILAKHFIEYVVIDQPERILGIKDNEKEEKENLRETVHFKNFEKKFEIAKEDISDTLEGIVYRDQNVDVQELIGMLNTIIEQSSSGIDLCDMLYNMKKISDGIYSHSINVALLGQLLARWLKMSKEDIELIGLCGLLHDIGKLKIPKQILNKTTELTYAENELIKKHAIEGYNILRGKDLDLRVKQVALTHHEHMNGTGYPLKVQANNIIKFARIIAIVDLYDLMTSKQPSQEAICPFEVVHTFEVEGYQKFDPSILMVFLSNILNNFIHYQVKLSNGQEGEIIFINQANLSRPLVKVGTAFIDLAIRNDLRIVSLI